MISSTWMRSLCILKYIFRGVCPLVVPLCVSTRNLLFGPQTALVPGIPLLLLFSDGSPSSERGGRGRHGHICTSSPSLVCLSTPRLSASHHPSIWANITLRLPSPHFIILSKLHVKSDPWRSSVDITSWTWISKSARRTFRVQLESHFHDPGNHFPWQRWQMLNTGPAETHLWLLHYRHSGSPAPRHLRLAGTHPTREKKVRRPNTATECV